MSPKRLSAPEARRAVAAGALLVAVTSPASFRRFHLDGAIDLDEFERRLAKLPRTTTLVFY